MSINTYIVSGNGFYGGKILKYDKDFPNKVIGVEILWVDNVRNAKILSGKLARNVQKCINFPTFLWNPYKEEPIKNKWRVVKRSSNYDIFEETYHHVLEWRAIKVVHESLTDVKYLSNRTSSKNEVYYNEEDAKKLAKSNNVLILNELTKILNND